MHNLTWKKKQKLSIQLTACHYGTSHILTDNVYRFIDACTATNTHRGSYSYFINTRSFSSPRMSLKNKRESLWVYIPRAILVIHFIISWLLSPEYRSGHQASPDGSHPVNPVVGPVVGHHGWTESPSWVQTRARHVTPKKKKQTVELW